MTEAKWARWNQEYQLARLVVMAAALRWGKAPADNADDELAALRSAVDHLRSMMERPVLQEALT